MKNIIYILFCSFILCSTSFAYQTETYITSNDATLYADNRIPEINKQVAWKNYIAQISPEEIAAARKGIVKPLPKTKREEISDSKTVEGIKAVIDYDRGVFIFKGREIPFDTEDGEEMSGIKESVTLFHLPSYNRFEVYVEQNYYDSNTEDIIQFFELFEPRFNLLESETGWNAEIHYNKKSDIVVLETSGCYGGTAYGGDALFYAVADRTPRL